MDSSCSVFMNVKQKCYKIWHVSGSAQPNIQVLSHSPFLQRTKVMHYLNISQQYSGTSTGVTEPGGKLESGSFSVLAPATNQDRPSQEPLLGTRAGKEGPRRFHNHGEGQYFNLHTAG